ncbi:DinB family protein [Pontibacter sp. BT310]|uniref:DinB family protein n=1 Tax=Pontibacter populi TaxID=890055 RepID=A0ABS6XE78_9BACT|nr:MULTISPECIES: DinB family protein [Pontibacter]MBJ6118984.1 DinB family protein [Pontibacter sp. BT310]MBR0571412.1 DinB family protein [Microvirga sp. STS03]MBW3365838.1 DinB family protein [Pontibacter populi]
MTQTKKLEVWLRGPVNGVPALLQPVAHALQQACEEVESFMQDFPEDLIWERPAGVASVGYHLQHLTGILQRLLTYARGEALSEDQLAFLYSEGKPTEATAQDLVQRYREQLNKALEQLKQTDENTLTEVRRVGRAQVESTVMGLLFHAAEHSMRHVGQLLVTARVLRGQAKEA